jgi:hypothetical protein
VAMLDWNSYRQQLTVRIGEIAKISPDTIRGYQSLSAAGQKANLLGPKIPRVDLTRGRGHRAV